MARPKEADSAATYDGIVAASLEVLRDGDGAPDISLRSIASLAGVSLGTVRYYFANKDELLEACLDEYYASFALLVSELRELAEQETDSQRFVDESVRRFYRFVRAHRAQAALRLWTNIRRGQLHPRRQSAMLGALMGQAAIALERHVETRGVDTRLTIQATIAMIMRFALFSDSEVEHLVGQGGEEGRDAVEAFVVRATRRLVRPSDR